MKNKIKCLFLLILIVPCMFLFSACGGKVVVGFEKSTASTAFSDVYTITYNDGTSDSFSVSHGEDGEDLDIIYIYNVAKSEGAFSGSFSEFLELYLTFDLNVTDDRAAINKSLMSVVSIYSEFYYEKDNYINTIKDTAVGNGSGVVYKLDKTSGDAYIITNYHVIYLANEKSGVIADNICCALYGNKIEFDWKTNYDGSYVKNSDGYPMVEYSGEMIDCEFVGGSMLYDIAVIKISGSDIVKNSGLLEAKLQIQMMLLLGKRQSQLVILKI